MNISKNTDRFVNLDYFRIVSMLLILLIHAILPDEINALKDISNGGGYALFPYPYMYYIETFIYTVTQVCVNSFVLLSGYFLVNSKFKIKKLAVLWIEVVFYAVLFKVIAMATGKIQFSPVSLISCFAPILTGRYWFVTIYFGMYLLSPFFNIAIKAMNKKQHLNLVILLVLLFSGTISIHPEFKGMNSGGGWGLAWFSVLYFTAAYLRLYYKPSDNNKKIRKVYALSLLIFILCPVVTSLGLFVSQAFDIQLLASVFNNWIRYDSLPTFISTIALFIFFINVPSTQNKKISTFISRVSISTFGVYLIHAHANVCDRDFWLSVGAVKYLKYAWYPLYQLLVVFAIFTICVVIDYFRQLLFKLIKVDKSIDFIISYLRKTVIKIQNYLNIKEIT